MPDEVKAPETAPVVPDTPIVDTPEQTPDETTRTGQEELTDEQLLAKIQGKPAPEAPPPSADTKPEETPPPAPVPKVPEVKPVEPTLLAGKYKTEADLEKATLELAKKLNLQPSVVQVQLDAAKESKNYSTVEKLYKAMETELGKKPLAPPAAPVRDTPKVDTAPDDMSVLSAVTGATLEELARSPLAAELKELGWDHIPSTSEEVAELRKSNYAAFKELQRAFKETYDKFLGEAREYSKAASGVTEANTQTTESATKEIRTLAEANGLKLKDEDIASMIESAKKVPWAYENRHGINYLSGEALVDYFWAREFPKRFEEVKLGLKATAREEAMVDLKKKADEAPQSISTSRVAGDRNITDTPEVDLNSEKEVEHLGDKTLNEKIKGIFNRK